MDLAKAKLVLCVRFTHVFFIFFSIFWGGWSTKYICMYVCRAYIPGTVVTCRDARDNCVFVCPNIYAYVHTFPLTHTEVHMYVYMYILNSIDMDKTRTVKCGNEMAMAAIKNVK